MKNNNMTKKIMLATTALMGLMAGAASLLDIGGIAKCCSWFGIERAFHCGLRGVVISHFRAGRNDKSRGRKKGKLAFPFWLHD